MSEFLSEICEKPTVEQMFELNRLGVRAAVEQGVLRRSPKRDVEHAHIFLADQQEEVEESDENGMRYSTHRFTGRIARVGYQRWSMRIAESYWIRGIDPVREEVDEEAEETVGKNQDGFRANYLFEWSRAGVMYAKKKIHVTYKCPQEILDSRVNSFDNPEPDYKLIKEVYLTDELHKRGLNYPNMITAADEIQRVSRADCDRLITDIAYFHERATAEMIL